jgi:glyoxylate carboligase
MAITAVSAIRPRRGASLLMEILRSEGVDYIFGNPGTTELPLMDALLEVPAIRYILALQEASAVAMADGYAQAARRPGFLNLHTAGGLGHGMGNLLNASVSQTPLVVTAGQQDSRHTITDPLLFGDLLAIARPAAWPSSPATKSTPATRRRRWWRWRKPSARRCLARPGRRASPSPRRTRCGAATCRPRRPR